MVHDGEVDVWLDINIEGFRPFAFIDCLGDDRCAPGAGPINIEGGHREGAYLIQPIFFTRYGKMHGLEIQGLLLHNGLMGNIFCHSIAQNDRGLMNLSGLEEYLRDVLGNNRLGRATLSVW